MGLSAGPAAVALAPFGEARRLLGIFVMGLLYMNAWILPIRGPTNKSCAARALAVRPGARQKNCGPRKPRGPCRIQAGFLLAIG